MSPLKEPRLVNNILASVMRAIRMLILCSVNEHSKSGLVEHLLQPLFGAKAGSRLAIELLELKTKAINEKVLEPDPHR